MPLKCRERNKQLALLYLNGFCVSNHHSQSPREDTEVSLNQVAERGEGRGGGWEQRGLAEEAEEGHKTCRPEDTVKG